MAARHPGLEHRQTSTRLLIADFESPGASSPPGDSSNTGTLCRVFAPLAALGVELVRAPTAQETQHRLATEHFDVLVGSAACFGSGPLRSLAKVRQRSAIPILLVADPKDPIPAVIAGRALRRSQWDIVHQDAPPEELLLRTERLIEQRTLLEDLERANYHASHDDRTGLLRPVRFDGRLREHFSAAQRHRLELALVLVDLDDFGIVNKLFDHMVGDELIARAGSVIQMSLRTEDVGARIGGDEFALILPYTQRVDAARVVSRLAGRFRTLSGPPPHRYMGPKGRDMGTKGRGSGEGHLPNVAGPVPAESGVYSGNTHGSDAKSSISVSASIGFETFNGADLESPEQLRQNAERALRAAKERGGNQGVYFRSLESDDDRDTEDTIRGHALGRPRSSTSQGLTARLPLGRKPGRPPGLPTDPRRSAHEHRPNPIRSVQDEVPGGVDFEDQ